MLIAQGVRWSRGRPGALAASPGSVAPMAPDPNSGGIDRASDNGVISVAVTRVAVAGPISGAVSRIAVTVVWRGERATAPTPSMSRTCEHRNGSSHHAAVKAVVRNSFIRPSYSPGTVIQEQLIRTIVPGYNFPIRSGRSGGSGKYGLATPRRPWACRSTDRLPAIRRCEGSYSGCCGSIALPSINLLLRMIARSSASEPRCRRATDDKQRATRHPARRV
jgi:hypothetical protein